MVVGIRDSEKWGPKRSQKPVGRQNLSFQLTWINAMQWKRAYWEQHDGREHTEGKSSTGHLDKE